MTANDGCPERCPLQPPPPAGGGCLRPQLWAKSIAVSRIRTCAGKPYWISSPTPSPLGHHSLLYIFLGGDTPALPWGLAPGRKCPPQTGVGRSAECHCPSAAPVPARGGAGKREHPGVLTDGWEKIQAQQRTSPQGRHPRDASSSDAQGDCGFQRGKRPWRCWGLNPGPLACKASALLLSYIPLHSQPWGPHPAPSPPALTHCPPLESHPQTNEPGCPAGTQPRSWPPWPNGPGPLQTCPGHAGTIFPFSWELGKCPE